MKVERRLLLGVPAGDGAEEALGIGAVAYEVIVGKEDAGHAAGLPCLQFLEDALDRLESHLAAIHRDDVAEFAGKRAAARALHDPLRIAPLEHIQPRERRV